MIDEMDQEQLCSTQLIQVANDDRSQYADELVEKVVGCANVHFKSQQIGDPDLTLNEKQKIVREILTKSPAQFLSRFNQHLNITDLKYFDAYKDDYEVQFYLKAISERKVGSKSSANLIKNRRYSALQKLIKNGSYFSDFEMRKRNPQMFEQFVGQFMSKFEKEELDLSVAREEADFRLSGILMTAIERKTEENQSEEEFDSESDSDNENVSTVENDRQILKEEFVTNMHQSFLEGLDSNFDYSTVDNNTDYDPLDVAQQDAEDNYFDEEDSN